jgi:hypothetical protein
MNILQYVRRNLGITGLDNTSKQGRQFDQNIENLEERFNEDCKAVNLGKGIMELINE